MWGTCWLVLGEPTTEMSSQVPPVFGVHDPRRSSRAVKGKTILSRASVNKPVQVSHFLFSHHSFGVPLHS